MILPDSVSIFTAEIWVIIKPVGEIKNYFASKYIVFTDSLSWTSFEWDGDTKVYF